jgi:hypothetical protein
LQSKRNICGSNVRTIKDLGAILRHPVAGLMKRFAQLLHALSFRNDRTDFPRVKGTAVGKNQNLLRQNQLAGRKEYRPKSLL